MNRFLAFVLSLALILYPLDAWSQSSYSGSTLR